MKNKIAKVAFLLGCQALTSSAAFSYGNNDRLIYPSIQQPAQMIAQDDMSANNSAHVSPDSGVAPAEAPQQKVGRRRSSSRAFKRKHSSKGQGKHRLSSGMKHRPKTACSSSDNSCCAEPSSAM
jgi:hypothetical protein